MGNIYGDSPKMNIAPIAVDLGAENTGVYSAFYPAGSRAKDIKRKGFVYKIDNKNYTLLMVNRTAIRHQRRGFDRRQMAKRLLKLIWTDHFGLEWNKDISQTIGFLMNRRGFSFLEEEYNIEKIREFPLSAWNNLPKEFKDKVDLTENNINDNSINLENFIDSLKDDKGSCKYAYNILNDKVKKIKKDLVYFQRTSYLYKICMDFINNKENVKNSKKKSNSNISLWIYKKWTENGIWGFDKLVSDSQSIDIFELLSSKNLDEIEKIKNSIDNKSIENHLNEAKKSLWNFDTTKFNFKNFEDEHYSDDIHINHLAYALYKIHNELESGSRYRARYFKEIYEVLENKNHTHNYLKNFSNSIQNKEFGELTVEKLKNLIGHISNLELKPLRKYFNDEKHKGGDYWDEKRLEKIIKNWILREWRVDFTKDKNKEAGKSQDYAKLKNELKDYNDGIIKFFLNCNPEYTIPPYQNNNNKGLPRCQSLILNKNFLNNKYPDWKKWLKELEDNSECSYYIGNFRESLLALKSGKGNSYFEKQDDSLDARVLQFILDRVKVNDSFLLNEIYSYTKKIRQDNKVGNDFSIYKDKLLKSIDTSSLPNSLKDKPNFDTVDIFSNGSFLHLICRYYRIRQRARDGRVFIHPKYKFSSKRGYEKTNSFDDDNYLLTYCNRKPRKKQYQMFYDFSSVLQISPEVLEEKIGSKDEEDLLKWIKSFKILTHCEKCSKFQKEFRGNLKNMIYYVSRDNFETKDKNLEDLKKLIEKSEEISKKIAEALFPEKEVISRADKFKSIYSFSQINNIVFKDRGGYSNTCPICSIDNSSRMESIDYIDKSSGAKAQRLPAIPTRVIDGAVMKVFKILSKKIVSDNWEDIKNSLENNIRVRIPIITESNRFEFEPSLQSLKNKKDNSNKEDLSFDEKINRIKNATKRICPYTGESLGENGEIDHIIPRSSKWGTLNDEANLIYCSNKGNNKKLESIYTLSDLDSNYKLSVFKTKNDFKIEEWIKLTIWDSVNKKFKFGKYRSFINLGIDEQIAFRHALFFRNGDEVKTAVIMAINNKNRTLVNGTQRYFAETLANEFYKNAIKIRKENLIEFDYFGVEAYSNSRGDGIKDLRRDIENIVKDLDSYKKNKGKPQHSYSHLIDAHLAFMIIADKHQKNGSLEIIIQENSEIHSDNNKNKKQLDSNLFLDTQVLPNSNNFSSVELKRRKPENNFTNHRSFTRDTIYAAHYLPILMKKVDNNVEVRVGYYWNNNNNTTTNNNSEEKYNSVRWDFNKKNLNKNIKIINELIPFFRQSSFYPKIIPFFENLEDLYTWFESIPKINSIIQNNGYLTLSINKEKLHSYMIQKYNTKEGVTPDEFFNFCSSIRYKTEKRNLILEEMETNLTKGTNIYSTLEDKSKFSIKFNKKSIILPLERAWGNLKKEWEKAEKQNIDFNDFLRSYFGNKAKRISHQKVRKVFSLPIVTTSEGKFLIKRKSWNGKDILQILNDSDPRKINSNKIGIPVLKSNNTLGTQIADWGVSSNFMELSKKDYASGEIINCQKWYELDSDKKDFPEGVSKIQFKIPDNSRPTLRLTFSKDVNEIDLDTLLKNNELCKGRADDAKKYEELKNKFVNLKKGDISVEYSGVSKSQSQNLYINRLE